MATCIQATLKRWRPSIGCHQKYNARSVRSSVALTPNTADPGPKVVTRAALSGHARSRDLKHGRRAMVEQNGIRPFEQRIGALHVDEKHVSAVFRPLRLWRRVGSP
ncbi:MAG: hypothetical protein LQ345_006326 [Seirophora villosa]|nr:MAG: hypothetical protein LQ345_006326 [Seirophora villosa]